MAGQVTNLIYGPPSYIKIGPYGTAEGSCTDIGFTDGGVKLVAAYTVDKHMVDQHKGPVDVNLKEVNFTLEMTLAEPSLANLKYALGLSDDSLAGSILSVGSGISIPKLTIYFQGPGPNGGTRNVKIQRCYLSDPTPLGAAKANSNLTLKFTLLEDTTVVDSKQAFLVITDASGDTTAPTFSSTTPTDGASGIAISVSPQIIFSEAINGADVNGVYFKLVKASDGTGVAGSLALSADKTTVTFDPTSNLSAATAYILVISQGIRDLAGNKLAVDSYVNFTTV